MPERGTLPPVLSWLGHSGPKDPQRGRRRYQTNNYRVVRLTGGGKWMPILSISRRKKKSKMFPKIRAKFLAGKISNS